MEAMLGRILDAEVEGAMNLRDLGGHKADGGRVREGLVFRSAMTHHLTAAGLGRLASELRVRTVVDLRNENEIASDGVADFASAGIVHHHIPITATAAMTPDEQRARLLSLRDGSVSWFELYSQMAESAGESFAKLFHVVAETDAPLLFHCTGGRDRTGLSAALLLGLLGVLNEDIARDYALTGAALAPHAAKFERNMREMEMSLAQWHRLVETTGQPALDFLEHIRVTHGSIPEYLSSIGVGRETQSAIRHRLVA